MLSLGKNSNTQLPLTVIGSSGVKYKIVDYLRDSTDKPQYVVYLDTDGKEHISTLDRFEELVSTANQGALARESLVSENTTKIEGGN